MKIENLYVGQTVPNYRKLCEILGIKSVGGSSKMAQIKEFERYVKYHKDGNKFIIEEIYDKPKDKEDRRGGNNVKFEHILSPKELSNEFDGFYVYRHIQNGEVVYVGKGCKRRVVRGEREYDIKEVEKEIVKRFDDELESILFEKQLIEYYKSLGQCKYNSDDYYTGSFVNKELKNKIKIKSKPKKVNKQKSAYELLGNLGYEFDVYEGWKLKDN